MFGIFKRVERLEKLVEYQTNELHRLKRLTHATVYKKETPAERDSRILESRFSRYRVVLNTEVPLKEMVERICNHLEIEFEYRPEEKKVTPSTVALVSKRK